MDYHYLDGFANDIFDGAYTMETFVHATDDRPPKQLWQNFTEYDHSNLSSAPSDIRKSMDQINKYASMPAKAQFDKGVLEKMILEVGFVDVVVRDLTVNVTPMLRLFFVLAYIPFLIIKFLGLQAWFVNTVAGVEAYRGREFVRYVTVSAKKPSTTSAIHEGLRERKR